MKFKIDKNTMRQEEYIPEFDNISELLCYTQKLEMDSLLLGVKEEDKIDVLLNYYRKKQERSNEIVNNLPNFLKIYNGIKANEV